MGLSDNAKAVLLQCLSADNPGGIGTAYAEISSAIDSVSLDSNGNIIATVIHRHGTTLEMANVQLADGQIGIDTTVGVVKIGNGTTLFSSLPVLLGYVIPAIDIVATGPGITGQPIIYAPGKWTVASSSNPAASGVVISLDAIPKGVPFTIRNATANTIMIFASWSGGETYFSADGATPTTDGNPEPLTAGKTALIVIVDGTGDMDTLPTPVIQKYT